MQTWIMCLVTGLVIVIGLVILLDPSLAVFLVAAIVPYVLITFIVRKQQVTQTRKCVERYVQARSHMRRTS